MGRVNRDPGGRQRRRFTIYPGGPRRVPVQVQQQAVINEPGASPKRKGEAMRGCYRLLLDAVDIHSLPGVSRWRSGRREHSAKKRVEPLDVAPVLIAAESQSESAPPDTEVVMMQVRLNFHRLYSWSPLLFSNLLCLSSGASFRHGPRRKTLRR